MKPSIPHPDKQSEWYQVVEANPERSPRAIGEPCGLKQAAGSRRLTARKRAPFTHGAPERAPDIARQRDVDGRKTHVSVMEALIVTLYRQPTSRPGSPNGVPTHPRGFVTADDLREATHASATAHHRQVQDVPDPAWHRCLAQLGQEVGRA